MRLSLLVVRKRAPIRQCAFNRDQVKFVIVHESMIGSNRWKKIMEKWAMGDFFDETHFVKIKSPNPSQWNIAVLSIADLVQLALRNSLVN